MATAYEIPQDTAQKASSDTGSSALGYTRSWRIVKSTRSETVDIPTTIGVDIGSVYPGSSNVTCTALSSQPDGDSLMSIIATATYASPKNIGATAGVDRTIAPGLRPATVQMSSSFEMVDTNFYILDPLATAGTVASKKAFAVQPTGELISGLKRPSPVVNFTIVQWESSDPTSKASYVGKVNSNTVTIGGEAMQPRSLLCNGISYSPQTETWQGSEYTGWQVTYNLSFRVNKQIVLQNIDSATGEATDDVMAEDDIGWDQAIPLRGLNCLNTMDSPDPIDPYAFQLKPGPKGIKFGAQQTGGYTSPTATTGPVKIFVNGAEVSAWWNGTEFLNAADTTTVEEALSVDGSVVRAMVASPTSAGGFSQSPSGQPIPLNIDGTPRARYNKDGADPLDADYLFRGYIADPLTAVLAYRRGIHDSEDFTGLGIR